MTDDELNKLQNEVYDHLWNGRHRMALTSAEKLYSLKPNDSEATICLAWAYLENGQPTKAMEFANLAVELKGNLSKTRYFRAYLLTRMSIYEGAIADIEKSIGQDKNLLSWTYLNQARAFAGLKKFDEANKALAYGLLLVGGENKEWESARKWFQKAAVYFSKDYKIKSDKIDSHLEEAREAIKSKEYWFALFTAQKILANTKSPEAELVELDAMFNMYQYSPALKKADAMKSRFMKNERFNAIYNSLIKFKRLEEEESEKERRLKQEQIQIEKTIIEREKRKTSEVPANYKLESLFYPSDFAEVFSIKLYDASKESTMDNRKYFKQTCSSFLSVGVEVIFNNPLFRLENATYNCCTIWYLNDYEVGRNNFRLNVPSDWDSVIFTQTMGAKKQGFWDFGQAKVEVYIKNFKVAERFFGVNESPIEEKELPPPPVPQKKDLQKEEKPQQPETEKPKPSAPEKEKTLEELLAELDSFIGLTSIKESVRGFISYLEFIKERKKFGLKADDRISINAVFLGNPGTGKTTIARLLGNILKAMGIIPQGHVIEVDRAALVGQYIGETAQKTEKVITDAIGGVLFIDEAYTLVKKGGAQDFGQEAIDVLLKRMEDKKGEFVVIAAGYTDEMNAFLVSNPGMKSRFTHTFTFEDYTPDEMMQILERNLHKEEYKITNDAKEFLKKEFIKLYRGRDKTFGNARLVRNFVEGAKLNLGKRVVSISGAERTKDILNTITLEDIEKIVGGEKSKNYNVVINEETLKESLADLENLVGLSSVKKEIKDLVKLARFFAEQGENISEKFNAHYLFLGNPGTGKTTVARIFSKIFSALGILTKGHLVETDRQGLVAGFVGQTAEKTTAMIDKSFGGTLFIDEAYALVKKDGSGSDFGKEAIDILLKRMEDDRGKFITIAAGYTDEMKEFIASNPGMQSRFQKSLTFEDYTPEEMMEIVQRSLKKDKKNLAKDAEKILLDHFTDMYKNRDKKFGNARIVRNILEAAKQKLLLRVADIPQTERTEEKLSLITVEDINQVVKLGAEARDYEVKGDPLKLQEYIDELNALPGLDNIKQGIYRLISGSKVAQLRKERGLQVIEKNMHAIFIGNSNTGKKTVARLLSKILKELGVLEKGHFVKVDRSDLVAGYQGQTAIKTEKVIQEAIGGTLFVDEIYSLSRDDSDYGNEAIITILKKMEELKSNFVVIASGSTKEMESFLEINPNFSSFFNNMFNFEDYNPRQLLAIAFDIAEKNGYSLDEGALQIMLELFEEMYEKRTSEFGNAKVARNLLYSAISCQEERIAGMLNPTDNDLKTITLEDVQSAVK